MGRIFGFSLATILAFTIVLALAFSPWGMAQTTTAKISGVVTDETGGVLPGAQVTVTNVETGVKRDMVTGESGQYRAPFLQPGTYRLGIRLLELYENMISDRTYLKVAYEKPKRKSGKSARASGGARLRVAAR